MPIFPSKLHLLWRLKPQFVRVAGHELLEDCILRLQMFRDWNSESPVLEEMNLFMKRITINYTCIELYWYMYIMYNALSFFVCHQKPKTSFYPHSACLSGRPVPDGIFKCRGDDSQTDESHSQDDPINVNVKSKDILKLKISFLWWVRLCKALANEGKIKIKSNT